MSQVTSPVILDSTGQDIVTQLAAISAAIASGAVITGNTNITLSGVLQGLNDKVAVMPVDNAPTDNSTNLVSSGGVKTALDGKANPGQLAYPETGTTASRNYTAGQYISWNGLLCTANQSISIGTTLSADTGGNLTECVGGGFNVTASKEWKFVRNIDTANVTVTSELDGHGYSEILLILSDKATESSDKVQLATAIYPLSFLDNGIKCRAYFYNGNIYFCGITKINGEYKTEVLTGNSIGRLYAR